MFVRSDLVILTPFPAAHAHTFLAYTLLPLSTSIRILFFKEGMTGTHFVNYYQSKNTNNNCTKLLQNVDPKQQEELWD